MHSRVLYNCSVAVACVLFINYSLFWLFVFSHFHSSETPDVVAAASSSSAALVNAVSVKDSVCFLVTILNFALSKTNKNIETGTLSYLEHILLPDRVIQDSKLPTVAPLIADV